MAAADLALISPNSRALNRELVARTLADWPEGDRPRIGLVTPAQVCDDEAVLAPYRAAWVLLDRESAGRHLNELIAVLESRQIPVVMTLEGDRRPCGSAYHDGLTLIPDDAAAGAACAALRSAWNLSKPIQMLRRESRFLQARHTGLCDRFDKIDEELRLAALLQREFLPRTMPATHQAEFRVFFRPAGYVSGDIYDVVHLDDERVGLFIADAVGHGVPAALMTIFIKNALRTTEPDPSTAGARRVIPPGEVLARLNDVMAHQQAGRMSFPSACYCVINCRTLEVTCARAGSPFPMLLRRSGQVEWVEPKGSLLGVFPDKDFEAVSTRLEPGDRMLLFSDGFELAFPSDSDAGPGTSDMRNEAYVKELAALGHGPLDEAMERFTQTLDGQVGSLNQRDDLTILCVGAHEDAVGDQSVAEEADDRQLAHSATR